jgi:hypothetical protein
MTAMSESVRHFDSRDLILIAAFGTIWGLIETTLGNFLKIMRIPMAGSVMGPISITICLVGYFFIRKKRAIFLIGCVASLIKILSAGSVLFSPFAAILIEASIAEMMIRINGVNRFSFMTTGTAVVMYPMIHPFLVQGLIFGSDIFTLYTRTYQKLVDMVGLHATPLVWIIIPFVLIHALLGSLSGLYAYRIGTTVTQKLAHNEQ